MASSYLTEYDKLNRSGVGIVLTRSREPLRVLNELMSYAFSYELEETKPAASAPVFGAASQPDFAFKAWDVLEGWTTYTKPVNGAKIPGREKDDDVDAFSALSKLSDHANSGRTKWGPGLYVMTYLHWHLATPQMIQMLKHYASVFTKDDRRLVIISPEGWQPPQELSDDMTILDFVPPDQQELLDHLTSQLERLNDGDSPYSEIEMNQITSAGQGMTLAEFDKTVARAVVENEDTWPDTPIASFLKVVMKAKTEVVARTEVLAVIPTGDMRQVGGLSVVKEWVEEEKMCMLEDARDFGVDRTKGILGVGVPGTGKSLVAKAIAGSLGLPLIQFKVGRCFGSYVGESEQRIELALNYLASVSPCVAWIDEIDKAGFGKDTNRGSDTTDRVLQALLTFMSDSEANVIWLATANRIGGIPPELVRPGRFDLLLGFGLPKAAARLEVLQIHLKKRKQKLKNIGDLSAAVDAGKGYTPAELEKAVKQTIRHCYCRKEPVTPEVLVSKLGKIKPYIKAFAKDYKAMNDWIEQYATPSDDDEEEELTAGESAVRKIRTRQRPTHGEV